MEKSIVIAPMSEAERSILKLNTSSAMRSQLVRSFFVVFCVLTAITFVILLGLKSYYRMVDYIPNINLILFIVSIVGSAIFTLVVARQSWNNLLMAQKSDPIQKDLDEGRVHIQKFKVVRAVKILPYEDDGEGFFLELSTGAVLCIMGQDLPPVFPQEEIEYRFVPHSGWRVGVHGIGPELAPIGRVQFLEEFYKEDGSFSGPEDGEFYEGPIENALAKFNFKLS